MKSTGVRTLRFALNWYAVQPRRGAPRWGGHRQAAWATSPRGGSGAAPFVYGSPRWVAKRHNRPPLGSLRKARAWRNFLASFVRRYGPGGGYWSGAYQQQHPNGKRKPISSVQIWNEPNLEKFFPKKKRTRKYAKLVKISHGAINGVSRRVKVVLAGLTGFAKPRGWTFLHRLYRVNGIKRKFDAAALHPYAATIGQFRSELRRMRRVMKRHHDNKTALWLTEVGWGSARHTRRFPLNKGRQGQKRMLKKSFRLVRNHRRSWRIKRRLLVPLARPRPRPGGLLQLLPLGGPPSPQPQAEARLPRLQALHSELTAAAAAARVLAAGR